MSRVVSISNNKFISHFCFCLFSTTNEYSLSLYLVFFFFFYNKSLLGNGGINELLQNVLCEISVQEGLSYIQRANMFTVLYSIKTLKLSI